ncbi:MAG: PAS domain S-box protein [Cytophagales bacterium]|jgi:PAS domain S-box-containing protein|nr:PAS domain S-box protein [Bacteroidota bacterium]MBS1982033.1 PAS domain S-box protein [Bacteroidota bacterium]WHZ09490.1 MAG: PAS domain S-box protein [Cytophagales bacterium]
MFKNLKISTKITGLIVLLVALATLIISVFTYRLNRQAEQDKLNSSLTAVADEQAQLINHFFDHVSTTVKFLQSSNQLKNTLASQPDSLTGTLNSIKEIYSFSEVYLTTRDGNTIASTDSENGKGSLLGNLDKGFFDRAASALQFSSVKKINDNYFIFAAATLADKLIAFKINLVPVYKKLATGNIGTTGESYLAQVDPVSQHVIIVSPLRNDPGAFLKPLNKNSKSANEILKMVAGKNGSSISTDYREKEVLKVLRKIDRAGWGLVVKIDTDELQGQGSSLIKIYIAASIGLILLAWAIGLMLSQSLTQPLNNMGKTLELVSQGVLPENITTGTHDEFGQISEKVNSLVQNLKSSAEFAKKVGEGKLDTPFQPVSENDTLGQALLHMRDDLIDNEQKDNERNWIVRGVAEVAEILRAHDTVDELGNEVIQFIASKIGAIQGVFYDVNNDDRDQMLIEIRASFAYGRKKYLKKSFRFAEGLVGQAAAEKDVVMRTEIPDDYLSITSGILGEQKPKCILVMPLITNEEVYGLLEFAGLKKFDASQVKFVQELSVILARTIFNIKVNERTRKLLTESQQLSTELQEKQEVLRQNAEEMQATQEELKRSNTMLEEQIEEVNRSQKRTQLLLENASEVITIYEQDRTIRYSSPSVERILGYSAKELQGSSDAGRIHPSSEQIFSDLFDAMTARPDEKVTVQLEYKSKDGNYVWLECTGTNLMSNRAIRGYVLNSRDITERRRAEQEQRMRSKMQALSENSPDLITRLEQEAISYINPTIQAYTGKSPHQFLNKKVRETELDNAILDQWLSIVEQVNVTNNTVAQEMDFPTEMGKRIMQVNAIPEYDEQKNIESVLVVSHDITERKEIEIEIQNKNKKINDSINYAKRIQNAILPNTRLINKSLPDSFILYKPRDVVSGDFPWFVQTKNDIFIAAVDCTGHGVPGALLSLIGYFLLNDIVRSRKITEPGKILDLLDEGVTQTLRQDQDDSATKDGMDIALCRINIETRTVEYAGAHRPLYFMKNGVMDEIKGNKFPIGGGIYKNQTNFTTTKLELSVGDSFYFSSDGFPDQFGGPEVRKFGPKKTREIIERIHKNSMQEALQVFDIEWEAWKGEHKQTDDVLLIGIKF